MKKILDYKKHTSAYITEHWKYEIVHRLVLELNNKIIECSLFEHLDKNKKKVNVSIEISSMYGCPIRCKYCASNQIKNRETLTPEEMLIEVDMVIEKTKVDVYSYPKFVVSFSGIGEPSLIIDKIFDAGNLIYKKYPKVKFYLASTCVKPKIIDAINASKLPFDNFWVTYVHYDTKKAIEIIPTLEQYGYNFKKIIQKLAKFNLCTIKINCIFIKGFNDSLQDINELLKILSPIKDKIIIRITRINPTISSVANNLGIISTKKLLEIAYYIQKQGFQKHLYYTDKNDDCNCGQLIHKYKKDLVSKK